MRITHRSVRTTYPSVRVTHPSVRVTHPAVHITHRSVTVTNRSVGATHRSMELSCRSVRLSGPSLGLSRQSITRIESSITRAEPPLSHIDALGDDAVSLMRAADGDVKVNCVRSRWKPGNSDRARQSRPRRAMEPPALHGRKNIQLACATRQRPNRKHPALCGASTEMSALVGKTAKTSVTAASTLPSNACVMFLRGSGDVIVMADEATCRS